VERLSEALGHHVQLNDTAWDRTFRNECLDHVIPLDERHLHTILAEYVAYYNAERPHQSLGLEPPLTCTRLMNGSICARPVLGGLHYAYQRAA